MEYKLTMEHKHQNEAQGKEVMEHKLVEQEEHKGANGAQCTMELMEHKSKESA